MAIYHKRKDNHTSMQPIPNISEKERLQKQIMELMKERMKARSQREALNSQKTEFRKRLLENARLNQQLDYRIDSLMRRWSE